MAVPGRACGPFATANKTDYLSETTVARGSMLNYYHWYIEEYSGLLEFGGEPFNSTSRGIFLDASLIMGGGSTHDRGSLHLS